MINTSEAEIHIGESTHHHDQSILSNSFKTINTIVSNPQKPIPPLDELDVVDILFPPFILSITQKPKCRPT